ncbi:PD-(D/E)XK nuclease superfamily protein [Bacillus thuringiensis]|uniref:PD-(D/E)XK nuclease superfamily protein n=1 Tax=Bacillus thuringiensis TaxID=1428 RepID=UPI0021D661F3|nr:PD-(D/E)XK nuclease superfamily protein [Bacillus thuringiensis]MCU7666820.1 hypothetical protein [Bacillus thuringiensis]
MVKGTYANETGRALEKRVANLLDSYGFKTISEREYNKNPEKHGSEVLLTNVKYTNIYGQPGKSEFMLCSRKYNMQLRIECKWQQSSGSVDEKYPYLLLNCVEAMPEKEVIIVVDGGGARKGAVAWLKNNAKTVRNKSIRVINFEEFKNWARYAFREENVENII